MWTTASLRSHFISAYLRFQSIFDENKLALLIQTNWEFSWSCSSFFGQLMRDACHELRVFHWPYCYILPVKPTWTNAFLGFYFITCLTSVLWVANYFSGGERRNNLEMTAVFAVYFCYERDLTTTKALAQLTAE